MKEGRKIRSDKKVDVKPTLPISIKLAIYDTAYIANRPIKEISESICINAMKSESIIEHLSKNFRREFLFRSTMIIGREERAKIIVPYGGESGKITIKFMQKDYDDLCRLAYALDISPTSTASILLRIAYHSRLLSELSK